MRPGPGLVVMALAFISGARRGSTSSISSKTTTATTTTSSPPTIPTSPLPPILPPISLSPHHQTPSAATSSSYSFTATATSAAATTANTIITTSSPPFGLYEHFGFLSSRSTDEEEIVTEDHHKNHQHHHQKQQQLQVLHHQHKDPAPFNFFNTFYTNNNFLQRSSSSSSSLFSIARNTPYSLYSSGNNFAYTLPPLPSHITLHYDDPRIRSESKKPVPSLRHPRRATAKYRRRQKRRTRSANVSYKGSGAGEAGENLNDSDDSTSQSTAVDSSSTRDSASSDQTLARGLPVHFPSLTAAAADSSRSFDEDDIFALVAEDDLLSEESFDRLIKLTDDKIGDTNEEDYSSGTETVVSSSSSSSSSSSASTSGSGSGATETQDTNQQNAIEDFERLQQSEQPPPPPPPPATTGDQQHSPLTLQQHQESESKTPVAVSEQNHQSSALAGHDERRRDDDAETLQYNAHLVSNNNEKVVSITDADTDAEANAGAETIAQGTTKAELESPERPRSILESDFPLTRLNPWISACDLAQPGPQSAPDLQGECSAGTLPVARVDEGPGPPKCLKSCKNDDEEEETPFTNKLNKDKIINSNNSNNNNNNNNSNKNNINNNNNNNKHKNNKNDNKLVNKLVGYTTTTNTFNIKLRNSQPTISHSSTNNDNNNNNKKDSSSSGSNNGNKRVKQQRSQKLLNPFNYYQIHKSYNNNNNKMAKTRRNSNETPPPTSMPAAGSEAGSLAAVTATGSSSAASATRAATAAAANTISPSTLATSSNATNNTTNISHATNTHKTRHDDNGNADDDDDIYEFMHKMQQDAATTQQQQQQHHETVDENEAHDANVAMNEDEDDVMDDVNVDDIDVNVHNDAAVADNAAFVMQLQQFQQQQLQQRQNQANNNIVKMKLTSRAGGATELKYNHLKTEHSTNGNGNGNGNNNHNNKRYHSATYQIQIKDSNTYMSNIAPGPLTQPPTTGNNNHNHHDLSHNTPQQQQQQQKQQQQQCLEYLGDSAETMPTHLCTQLNSPSHLLAQLRHLRLRNCCERNVYSALHTLALNATLGGGEQCVGILEDLMELDATASRITCGLAEILFRFDCRQVYSIIHQCEDCKEAYRRWVCSTLVPYFAEPNDVVKPILFDRSTVPSGRNHPHQHEQQQPTEKSKRQQTIMLNSNKLSNYPTSIPQSSNSSGTDSSSSNNKNTTMASNLTTSHITHNNSNISNRSNNGSGISSSMLIAMTASAAAVAAASPPASATSNFITATMANNNNNNNYDGIHYLQQQQHHVSRRALKKQQRQQHHVNTIQLNDKLNNNYIRKDDSDDDKNMMTKRPATLPATIAATSPTTRPPSRATSPSLSPVVTAFSSISSSAAAKSRRTRALTFDDIIFLNNSTGISFAPRSHSNIDGFGGGPSVVSSAGASPIAFGQNYHNKSTNNERKRKRNENADGASAAFYVSGNKAMQQQQQQQLLKQQSDKVENQQKQQQQQKDDGQQQQSFNFISTANSEDSLFVKDPVISKLLQRSKRKVEFRKRRRIRPCLSVCQTVEQKCPYLLPADRMPALQTQYAGEPTFLCLDYNIAETEEQLRKASHGPNECCYIYCSTAADGICTYCNEFLDTRDIELEAERISREQAKKTYNITLRARNQDDSDQSIRVETKIQQKLTVNEQEPRLKMSTVAIAVRNDTLAVNVTRLAERLPYYAYCEGVYYYDDDVADMPEVPYSEDCTLLPAVHSRCTIPYYASNYVTSGEMWSAHRRHNEAQKLMVWLSTLLCLWSCYTARVLRIKRIQDRRQLQQQQQQQQLHDLQIVKLQQQQQHQQQQQNNNNNTAFDRKLKQCKNCDGQYREIMQSASDCKKSVTVWYDVTENRILFIYMTAAHSPTSNAKRGRRRQLNDKDANTNTDGKGDMDRDRDRCPYNRRQHHDRYYNTRLRGTLRNFHEIVRRTQQIDLLYGKNALILLIHYTNRLKTFMQRTQPHRKRKLTHLKWRPKRRRTLALITRSAMQQMILTLKIMMAEIQQKGGQRMRKMATTLMKNCSNVSYSQCSCSLSSCSCNHINNNYNNNNTKNNNINNYNKNNNNNNKNHNIINNNYNYNDTNNKNKSMKKMKFNFSTCNFKNTKHINNNNYYYNYYHYHDKQNDKNTNNSSNHNHNNNNNKSNDTNLIFKHKQQQEQQQLSIIQLPTKTTTQRATTTHNRTSNSNNTKLIDYTFPQQQQIKEINKTSVFLSNSLLTNSLTLVAHPHQQQQQQQLGHHCHSPAHTPSKHSRRPPSSSQFSYYQQPSLLLGLGLPLLAISYNSKINNYRYFYDFNFDINDWWPRHSTWRWWWSSALVGPGCWYWWHKCWWRSLKRRYCCCYTSCCHHQQHHHECSWQQNCHCSPKIKRNRHKNHYSRSLQFTSSSSSSRSPSLITLIIDYRHRVTAL